MTTAFQDGVQKDLSQEWQVVKIKHGSRATDKSSLGMALTP
jgi:hypothetical protein